MGRGMKGCISLWARLSYSDGMRFRVAPPVAAALTGGEAVVALESTVITHGLPRPENLFLARRLEAVVREGGALPATVGLLGGELVVGLDEAELEYLAGVSADKASLWNLAALMASGRDAGTTVAATLFAAQRAGIEVFATGGIGGVHPRLGSEPSFDESADLAALARYPLLVVCSGAKSILDVEATLERLESLGVAVMGYRSDRFAGFYSPHSPWPVPARAETAAEVARAYRAQRALGLAAMIVSNPVTRGLTEAEVVAWVEEATREARAKRKGGKDLTPFLLARLAELSGGRSLEVNLRLLEENARLGAELARKLSEGSAEPRPLQPSTLPAQNPAPHPDQNRTRNPDPNPDRNEVVTDG